MNSDVTMATLLCVVDEKNGIHQYTHHKQVGYLVGELLTI